MAKAKKLPSGNWRVRVYSHTDAQGKKHYESFTASTKQQAEMMGAKFANDIDRHRANDITISEAVRAYIDANDGSLSPATIKGYLKDSKYFEPIGCIRIRKVTTKDLQGFVSSLSNRGLSPKTISNVWGLLKSSLVFSGCEQHFKIHLPPVPKPKKYAPSSEDVMALYAHASQKLKICIMLSAFHGMRRGEISALRYADLSNNALYVHADFVKGVNGWVYKETPKTDASNRFIYLTDYEVELLGKGKKDDFIVGLLPSSIGTNFYNLRQRLGINMRFHDLRGFYASMAVHVMPDIYLAHLGGWRENSKTIKRHYQKIEKDVDREYAQKMNEFFEDMTRNMPQDKEKRPK